MATVTKVKRSKPSSTPRSKTKASPTSESWTPTHEQIAKRAYQLWQERGQAHGQDIQDWLNAEAQLRDSPDRF